MTEFDNNVSSGVKRIIESPTHGEAVSLILRLEPNQPEETLDRVRDTVEEIQPLTENYLKIIIEEQDIRTLCGLSGVEKVELEGSGQAFINKSERPVTAKHIC